MERCPSTSRVISVRCQFCVYFSVETDPTKHEIRGPKTTKMAWTGSFRSDKYQAHHKRQHPSQWAIYNVCSLDEKNDSLTAKSLTQIQCFLTSTLAQLPHLLYSTFSCLSSMYLLLICSSILMTTEEPLKLLHYSCSKGYLILMALSPSLSPTKLLSQIVTNSGWLLQISLVECRFGNVLITSMI